MQFNIACAMSAALDRYTLRGGVLRSGRTASDWERYKTGVVYRYMTFAHLVDEIRQLPIEEKVELRHVLDEELSDAIRSEVLSAHNEALQEYRDGKLTFTSDPQSLLRSLEGE
jgi:hypothetical protein